MIKTENDYLQISQRIPESNMKWQVFHHGHISHKITHSHDRFHISNFETQSFIVDWQLVVDYNSDGEKLWY